MVSLFKTITSLYLDDDYVDFTDPSLIAYSETLRTPEVAHYWVPLKHVNLGPIVTAELACLPVTVSTASSIDEFRRTCRTFCVELATQIIERFPFASPTISIMQKLSFLNDVKKFKSIADGSRLLRCDQEAVNQEYEHLQRMNFINDYLVDENNGEQVEKFWEKVSRLAEFPLLCDLVERVSVLLHSSATVERIFSAINLNKRKLRNRLSNETISGLLHSKELGLYDIRAKDFEAMIKMMNSDIYEY